MFLIDFDHSSQQAFFHGFVKGLAAPSILYHTEPAPVVPKVVYLSSQVKSIGEILSNDWIAIGQDMTKVIELHGKEQSAQGSR